MEHERVIHVLDLLQRRLTILDDISNDEMAKVPKKYYQAYVYQVSSMFKDIQFLRDYFSEDLEDLEDSKDDKDRDPE